MIYRRYASLFFMVGVDDDEVREGGRADYTPSACVAGVPPMCNQRVGNTERRSRCVWE